VSTFNIKNIIKIFKSAYEDSIGRFRSDIGVEDATIAELREVQSFMHQYWGCSSTNDGSPSDGDWGQKSSKCWQELVLKTRNAIEASMFTKEEVDRFMTETFGSGIMMKVQEGARVGWWLLNGSADQKRTARGRISFILDGRLMGSDLPDERYNVTYEQSGSAGPIPMEAASEGDLQSIYSEYLDRYSSSLDSQVEITFDTQRAKDAISLFESEYQNFKSWIEANPKFIRRDFESVLRGPAIWSNCDTLIKGRRCKIKYDDYKRIAATFDRNSRNYVLDVFNVYRVNNESQYLNMEAAFNEMFPGLRDTGGIFGSQYLSSNDPMDRFVELKRGLEAGSLPADILNVWVGGPLDSSVGGDENNAFDILKSSGRKRALHIMRASVSV